MLTITETAVEKVKEILTAEGKENWGLRVFMSGGGCCGPSYGLDLVENGNDEDQIVEQDGLKIFVDSQTMETLAGKTFDYVKQGQQEGFAITGGAPSCSSGGCSSC